MDERESAQVARISVRAPKGLSPEMLRAYVGRCQTSLAAAEAALERLDYERLRVYGHHLKGSGGAYGIPPLTELGRLIEVAAVRKDAAELRSQLSALEKYLPRLDILPG